MKTALAWLLILLTVSAPCCLNDRDSLAAEVQRRPELIWVLVGRFERNPPLYYEMRIKRIEAELKVKPGILDLYDDISVAYDRIHKDDEALKWIERKRALLEKIDPRRTRDIDWYRYYANAGTFHAHHWIGLKTKDTREMELAETYIAKAIQFNPGAHEGREGFQLAAISWILGNAFDESGKTSFAKSPELHELAVDLRKKAAEGLAGLVRLGGAWESPDIFDALSVQMLSHGTSMLSQIAILRRDELVAQGKKALGPLDGLQPTADADYVKENQREFKKLRADADAWQDERHKFMLAQMKLGKHPDTDADFWKGYIERPKPSIWSPPVWETINWGSRLVEWGLPAAFLLAVVAIIFLSVRARRRRFAGV